LAAPARSKRKSTNQKPKFDHDHDRISEFDHGRILTLPLAELRPAIVNDQIYKPVDPSDPEVRELSRGIGEHGLKVPFAITLDNVILSGHRRRVACQLAGLTKVPCLRENILSTDPKFPTILVEYNRQREKTRAERLREEVIRADPEEAHRALVEHRRKASLVSADTIEIVGVKRRAKISKAKRPFLDAVRRVVEDRRDFWPLSDRQIHYALLNDPPLIHASKPDSRYANDDRSYKAVIDLLSRARLEGSVPWRAIADPTRPVVTWTVHQETGAFFREQLNDFLKGYYRDLMQSQLNHVEIIGEKNTIESVVRSVAPDYCIPYTIGRGYCSLPPRHQMAQRFRRSGKQKLILLALSDFDPEGEDIAHSFARSLRDDFGIVGVEAIKVALTAEQVADMGLPPIMKAKKDSSRYQGFVDRYGDDVFELEAIPPDRLQSILSNAIDAVIDVKAFNAEVDAEKRDAAHLDGVRRHVHDMLRDEDIG
jgi:hypothetical protein